MLALQYAPLLLFLVLLAVFGSLSERFLTPGNFINIVTQAAHIAIIAIGMTFVLLVAGIDLSVGANMYVVLHRRGALPEGLEPGLRLPGRRHAGPRCSAPCNAFVITRLRVPAFIATLATLFIGRAIALYFSGVKMIPFGKEILLLGRSACWASRPRSGSSCSSSCWPGSRSRCTTFGRQVYAVGADPEAAAKAGIDVPKILFAVYCICGVTAGIGGHGLGEPGRRRRLDLRLPEGVPGDRGRGAGRHLAVRRPRRRGRHRVRRGADPDRRERLGHDQRRSRTSIR